jgi:diguanylate cyclase (GGDEF)-like protein
MRAMFTTMRPRRPAMMPERTQSAPPAEARGRHYWAISCEIDGFREYNDIYGRAAGDELLRRVSDILACSCRSGDRIVRRSGKALAMVIAADSLDRAKACAARHVAAVESLQIANQASRFGVVTASMGLAAIAGAGDKAIEHTLLETERALARAARCGGNQVALSLDYALA